jgi:putative tricarboxylic transport membrane protein
MAGRPAWDDVAVGIAVLGLGLVVGEESARIPANAVYATVGPMVIPWIVAAALVGLGGALAVQGWRGGWAHEHEHGVFDLRSLGWLLAGLAADVALIERAGFIIASTALFVCTARAFESRRPLRDAAIGFVLALLAYVGFDRVLGYRIGSGLIESLI